MLPSLYFFSTPDHKPVVLKPEEIPEDPNDIKEGDSEVICLIKELLNTRIRPRIKADGGDIFFNGVDVDKGEVQVRLTGACTGCSSSSVTLKQGVERMVMHYIPEVKRVLNKGDEQLPLEEREKQSNEERKEMEYLDNFNKELDRLIAEEKARAKSSWSVCWKQTPQYISSNR